MESSGSGSVDCGVGSIVWVKRKNGSWWPGQILGLEELSSSHLTSPRSGTPVKLLGREDVSVRDWYNLEKSKRVKAFRCGEFDDCIERAEFTQGMPIKRREKYARREDAILHALEHERQLLKKQGKLGIASDQTDCRLSDAVKKGVATSPKTLGNDNEKQSNFDVLMIPYSDEVKEQQLSWEYWDSLAGPPLNFHLEDQVNFQGGSIDTTPNATNPTNPIKRRRRKRKKKLTRWRLVGE